MPRNIHPQQIHPEWGNMTCGSGQWRVVKPSWYTGASRSHHVGVHILTVCKALKLSELPEGVYVRFIDGNHLNYELSNLAVGTNSERIARALALRGKAEWTLTYTGTSNQPVKPPTN